MLNIDIELARNIKAFEIDDIRLNVETKTSNKNKSNNEIKVNRREFVAENCDRKRFDRKIENLNDEKLFKFVDNCNLKLTKLFL